MVREDNLIDGTKFDFANSEFDETYSSSQKR